MTPSINISRRKILIIGAMLLLVITSIGCSSREEKSISFLNKGVKLYKAGQYEKAALEFKNVIQLDPDFARAHLYLGKTYVKSGKPNKARGSLSRALKLNGDLDGARLDLGTILVMSGKGKEALENITPMIDKDPANGKALLVAAQAHLLLRQPDEAIKHLEKIDEKKKQVLHAYASAFNLLGKTEMVKEYLNKYQGVAPENPASYLVLSKIYTKEKDFGKAEAEIRKLISEKKEDPSYPLLLCKFFLETGQKQKAEAELGRLVTENPRE
ncbi:MAG: tetratricopeptide repeat protein, partial [Deltaproteobacteria bacterium]|nr:tetratricopeptide repeat protein [Deltaproteobacteria bacterium]